MKNLIHGGNRMMNKQAAERVVKAFFDRRQPIYNAAKAAKKVLEDISRKFKVNYRELLQILLQK